MIIFLFIICAFLSDCSPPALADLSSPLLTHYLKIHSKRHIMQVANQQVKQEIQALKIIPDSDLKKIITTKKVMANIYPVQSSALSPGKVSKQTINVMLPRPVFIIGDDGLSKQWLTKHAERLAQLHAQGFVVNVASVKAMHLLQSSYSSLKLLALPADSLNQTLGIKHYPVLISQHYLEQ